MQSFIIYGKPNCPNCVTAKQLLDSKGIPYEYIDVSVNATALEFLREQDFRSVPAIYKQGYTRVGGLAELKKFLKENHDN